MLIGTLFKHWSSKVFTPSNFIKKKYEAFKTILENDKKAHEIMAELEDIYYGSKRVDFTFIEKRYNELSESVFTIIESLVTMCPHCYSDLRDYFKKIDSYIRHMVEPVRVETGPPFTVPLKKVRRDDYALVGGKGFNLGRIGSELGLQIPEGFVISTRAFNSIIESNHLREKIDAKLLELDINSPSSLDSISAEITEMIRDVRIPGDLEREIKDMLRSLSWSCGSTPRLAVRSSAVGEDTRSSFAGQYRTVLNVHPDEVLDAYREVIASKYSPRALYYRINYGLTDIETPMAVIVLEMIDAASSGVMYTADPQDPESRSITIHSTWGLGELLVSGETSADIIHVSNEKEPKITKKKIGHKDKVMVFSRDKGTKVIAVEDDNKDVLSLDEESVFNLSRWGIRLEKYFGEPQDVEWCVDQDGQLFLLQSRPLRIEQPESITLVCSCEAPDSKVLLKGGEKACGGVGAGPVFRIDGATNLEDIPEGSVLVAENASPDYVKIIGRLNAVVSDLGSTAGHFSSVAREFGVPTLVNTREATKTLSQGINVTVYADGKSVYKGIVQSLLDCPCSKRDLIADSPFTRKLRYIINFISPLSLVDPEAPSFKTHGVRSIHDIVRFVHERAVREMFHMGEKRVRKLRGAKKLVSAIPMMFLVLDVGDGVKKESQEKNSVTIDDIVSIPMLAVFKGLSHPGIRWGSFTHFDWGEYDKIVMSGGIISPESAMFASYAVISGDYLNLNLRFGYHFVILDTICGDSAEDNYVLFRFSGGGADIEQRLLRAEFLKGVLHRLGFRVDMKSDLVDGELKGGTRETIEDKLDMVGRLLGATRLMDMYLKDISMVNDFADEFMKGRYHFAADDESLGRQKG